LSFGERRYVMAKKVGFPADSRELYDK